jgi:hypothetical protein
MKTLEPTPRLIGRVQFPLSDMLVNPAKYAPIVERMAIVGVDADLAKDRVTYTVWDASFKAVPESQWAPTYDVTVFDGRLMFSPRADVTDDAAYTARLTAAAS